MAEGKPLNKKQLIRVLMEFREGLGRKQQKIRDSISGYENMAERARRELDRHNELMEEFDSLIEEVTGKDMVELL